MVHALNEAWRVTRAEVLDIRPLIGEPQVIVRDRRGREWTCGGLFWQGGDPEGHPEADEALRQIIAEGRFKIESETQFDWIDEYESAEALVESVDEDWTSRSMSEDTALKLAQAMEEAGATPFIRQPIGVRLLRKKPGFFEKPGF